MNIQRAIDSSITLRNKRDLIFAFVDSVNVSDDTSEDWRRCPMSGRTPTAR